MMGERKSIITKRTRCIALCLVPFWLAFHLKLVHMLFRQDDQIIEENITVTKKRDSSIDQDNVMGRMIDLEQSQPYMPKPTPINKESTLLVYEKRDPSTGNENITVGVRDIIHLQHTGVKPMPITHANATMPEKGDSSINQGSDTVGMGAIDQPTASTAKPKPVTKNNISMPKVQDNTEATEKGHSSTGKKNIEVKKSDIMQPGWHWDAVPIVIESHKLIFFTVPKVGCTVFKQLFRRMMGYKNWRTKDPHDPSRNGLMYLNHYSMEKATAILKSPDWTNAVFVRKPKERFLSAFLDKAQGTSKVKGKKKGYYVINHCCPKKRNCVPESMLEFLSLTKHCHDPHW